MSVPVVDISTINKANAKALVQASHEIGLMYIEGSHFTKEQIDGAYALCKGYFDQTVEIKQLITLNDSNSGYAGLYKELLDSDDPTKGDPKEVYMHCGYAFDKPTTRVAEYLQARREFVDSPVNEFHSTLERVLQLLALGLEIPDTEGGKNYFLDLHDPSIPNMSTLRLLHYPGQQTALPEKQVRLGAHTDFGSVTLLLQKKGEEGLEVYSPKDEQWMMVPFKPSQKGPEHAPPLILNIADFMTLLTLGYTKSSLHRVVFPKTAQESNKSRYSIVYFAHPGNDVPVKPVPSPLIEPKDFRPDPQARTAETYLRNRLVSIRLGETASAR